MMMMMMIWDAAALGSHWLIIDNVITNVHNETIQNISLRMSPSGDWFWVNTVQAKIQNLQNSIFEIYEVSLKILRFTIPYSGINF